MTDANEVIKLIKAYPKPLCKNTDKEIRAAVKQFKSNKQPVNVTVRLEMNREESAYLRSFEKAAQQLIQLVQEGKLKKDVVRGSKTVQDLWKLLHRKRHPARQDLQRRLPASARIRGKRSAVVRNASNWKPHMLLSHYNVDETSSDFDVFPEISGGGYAKTKVKRLENVNNVLRQSEVQCSELEVVGVPMRRSVGDEGIESMDTEGESTDIDDDRSGAKFKQSPNVVVENMEEVRQRDFTRLLGAGNASTAGNSTSTSHHLRTPAANSAQRYGLPKASASKGRSLPAMLSGLNKGQISYGLRAPATRMSVDEAGTSSAVTTSANKQLREGVLVDEDMMVTEHAVPDPRSNQQSSLFANDSIKSIDNAGVTSTVSTSAGEGESVNDDDMMFAKLAFPDRSVFQV